MAGRARLQLQAPLCYVNARAKSGDRADAPVRSRIRLREPHGRGRESEPCDHHHEPAGRHHMMTTRFDMSMTRLLFVPAAMAVELRLDARAHWRVIPAPLCTLSALSARRMYKYFSTYPHAEPVLRVSSGGRGE